MTEVIWNKKVQQWQSCRKKGYTVPSRILQENKDHPPQKQNKTNKQTNKKQNNNNNTPPPKKKKKKKKKNHTKKKPHTENVFLNHVK